MPFLKDHFGILSATFQWLDLPESETLVFTKYQKYQRTSTRKPENQYQKYQYQKYPEAPVQKSADQVWRGKSWIFSDPNTPGYSPQPSAPPGKFRILF